MRLGIALAWFCALASSVMGMPQDDGSVLPFPQPAMESTVKPRLQDSTMKWPAAKRRLPEDAPNILIILLDDIGFGVADTIGGEVHTPTLSRLETRSIANFFLGILSDYETVGGNRNKAIVIPKDC